MEGHCHRVIIKDKCSPTVDSIYNGDCSIVKHISQ